MRMKEIATAMTRYSGTVQTSFMYIRDYEEKVAALKQEILSAQSQLNRLLLLQTELIECQKWTEFGLPSGMTVAFFQGVTGEEIKS